MALFKKKPKVEQQEGQEFEQTLVAEEPHKPEPQATLTEEPVAPDPFANRTEIPDQRETEFPAEVEPYLKHEGASTILLEKNFDRPMKLNMESRVTPSPRQSLQEKTWHPAREYTIQQIRREVDRLKVRPYKPGKWIKTQFPPVFTTTRRAQIPSNILAKRIVYETEGGFVIEVTFREGPEIRKMFFTVSSRGGRNKALAQVQSGRSALQTTVPETVMDRLHTPRKGEHLPYPPGQLPTYPISNNVDVAEIEGIGDTYARRLHELGIHTTDQLRLMNATVIANNLGTGPATVQAWQAMSELMIVEGVGKQLAEVLVRAGIGGIDDLKKAKPASLAKAVREANKANKNRITGASIGPKSATRIIRSARKLRKTLQPFPILED